MRSEGSRLEAWMKIESQVRGCYNITFIDTNQEGVCVGKRPFFPSTKDQPSESRAMLD